MTSMHLSKNQKDASILLFLIIVFGSVAAIFYARLFPPLSEKGSIKILLAIPYFQLLAAIPLFVWLKKKTDPSKAMFSFHAPQVVLLLLVMGAMMAVIVSLSYVFYNPNAMQWSVLIYNLSYQFFFIALAEEVIFRGLPFTLWSNTKPTILISSLFFALYHVNSGEDWLIYYFAFGFVFGAMRYAGVPLVLLIAGHTLFNVLLGIFPTIAWPHGKNFYLIFSSLGFATIACLVILYKDQVSQTLFKRLWNIRKKKPKTLMNIN